MLPEQTLHNYTGCYYFKGDAVPSGYEQAVLVTGNEKEMEHLGKGSTLVLVKEIQAE